jgi:VWFA-related protein
MRSVARRLAAVVAVAVAAGATARMQEPQVFRSGANAVAVDVTVRDRSRRIVTGLTAADFTITDNGAPQEIASISFGKLPIDVTIALDVSYSVTGLMLERLRAGVVQLMGDLTPQDRLKLMLFNSRVTRTVDFTTDAAAVETAIRTAAAGGGTSLLDTISVSLLTPAPPDRRQLLVVFCDGSDSTSTTTPNMLASIALRSHTTIAMVMPGLVVSPNPTSYRPSSDRVQTAAEALLSMEKAVTASLSFAGPPRPLNTLFATLAAATGGTIVPAPASANLSAVFRSVLRDFRSAYVLHYNVRGVDRSGYHTLDVKVNRKDVEVIARRGYWY